MVVSKGKLDPTNQTSKEREKREQKKSLGKHLLENGSLLAGAVVFFVQITFHHRRGKLVIKFTHTFTLLIC